MSIPEYLIVGTGLTGATIARILHDKGYKVLVLDRRSHYGGNVFDHVHESGITVHTYGPHYFRTTDDNIWNFVSRFASFYTYIASIKTFVDGKYENWPIGKSYVDRYLGKLWKPSFFGKPSNFEEAALSLMPLRVYEKFIKEYNIKQWGVDPKFLSPNLIKRFDIRHDDDPRLTPHHMYQGIPEGGYRNLMKNMLKDIPVILNVDYLLHKAEFRYKKMLVFTGPIDEFFGFCLGRLHYRGQVRKHYFLDNQRWHQPCCQVNNPLLENGLHIRTLEWKHLMREEKIRNIKGTLITLETTRSPDNPDEYEYPFPDQRNQKLYKQYQQKVNELDNVLICGRLGEYKYYDMDQAIGRAMHLVRSKILTHSI